MRRSSGRDGRQQGCLHIRLTLPRPTQTPRGMGLSKDQTQPIYSSSLEWVMKTLLPSQETNMQNSPFAHGSIDESPRSKVRDQGGLTAGQWDGGGHPNQTPSC